MHTHQQPDRRIYPGEDFSAARNWRKLCCNHGAISMSDVTKYLDPENKIFLRLRFLPKLKCSDEPYSHPTDFATVQNWKRATSKTFKRLRIVMGRDHHETIHWPSSTKIWYLVIPHAQHAKRDFACLKSNVKIKTLLSRKSRAVCRDENGGQIVTFMRGRLFFKYTC